MSQDEAVAWVHLTTLALSLRGLGASLYLTIAHYTTAIALACPGTVAINCEKVTTSPQSMLLGAIPVARLLRRHGRLAHTSGLAGELAGNPPGRG